ncbi:MAG: tRNA preQ1(34) S-adenosylmethionine ribosyltransferase-isomerase QueA [Phycisphaeraceae bacterium]|nr:tRNA preQ1(34) S-adenosylmethionine ribosyltransferase-isomerase QueA [Phycisphaeraceae bacterium]
MRLQELDYLLPPELIAATPAEPRDAARLLVVHRATHDVEHRHVRDLPTILREFTAASGTRRPPLLVMNDSRVLPAAFHAQRVATRGGVEGLYLCSPSPRRWRVMLQARGSLRQGESLRLAPSEVTNVEIPEDQDLVATLSADLGKGEWELTWPTDLDTPAVLSRVGRTPLPPYIRKARRERGLPEVTPDDLSRYNTVYAAQAGSVAAPTAGLHLTPALLDQLRGMGSPIAGTTLHVGIGTFAPIRCEDLAQHVMHEEWLSVPAATVASLLQARHEGRMILPIGTTTVRSLESLPTNPAALERANREGYHGTTNLFIRPADAGEPSFPWRFTDALMTNFHLPRSSLLALVAALPGVGIDRLKQWYELAVRERYRFYSYGDAMILL